MTKAEREAKRKRAEDARNETHYRHVWERNLLRDELATDVLELLEEIEKLERKNQATTAHHAVI